MVFNSTVFGIFIIIVLSGYYCLRWRYQNYLLLIASYVFYGFWDWRFLVLIFLSTIVDYSCGLFIERAASSSIKKRYLMMSVFTNLGILGVFKYLNFFVESAESLLTGMGLHCSFPILNIVLPVGISFYTFQTMSYTIDIYRGTLKPTRDFFTFALFVAYFPQLVAGPIERASRLLPQLLIPRKIEWPAVGIGIELILIGYLKKVGIADTIAPIVDLRFQHPELAGWSDLIISACLFSIQIYCDFSGYSDIARGISRLFGIRLMRNFEQPYLSRNIAEFWRRWHISLSSWFKDYLYIPLGGNRQGTNKTYRNLIITMLFCGLWHGANWTFVAWGALHSFYLVVHRYFFAGNKKVLIEKAGLWIYSLKLAVNFVLVTFSWIFFRSNNFVDAWAYITGIVSFQKGTGAFEPIAWSSPRLWLLCLILLGIDILQKKSGKHSVFLDRHWCLRGFAYAGIMVVIFVLGGIDVQVPFIYFQF